MGELDVMRRPLVLLALLAAACGPEPSANEAPSSAREDAEPFHPLGSVHAPLPPGRLVPLDGTDARLLLPAGFVTANRGTRLRHEEFACSVTVQELDRPFAEIAAAYEAGEWPENRVQYATELPAAVPEFDHDGRPAFHLVWRWSGQPYSEWMLITGDELGTLTVLASASNEDLRHCRDDMLAILRSARWDRGRERDAFAGQTVRLDPPEGLELVARADGRVVLGTPGDEQGPWLRIEAFAPALSGDALLEFARDRLGLPQNVGKIQLRETRPIERSGLAGYELDADAVDKRTGEAMLVHLVVVNDVENDRVVVARGTVSVDRAAEWLPAFQRATATLRRAPAASR